MDIIKGLQVDLYEVAVGDLTNFDTFIIVCTCRNSSWVYFKTSQHFDTNYMSKWKGTEFYLHLNITFLPRKRRMMKKMLMRSLNYFLKMKSGCKCTALTVSHFRMTFLCVSKCINLLIFFPYLYKIVLNFCWFTLTCHFVRYTCPAVC